MKQHTRDRITHALILLSAFVAFGCYCAAASAQTLDFTLKTSSTDGKTVTPTLTWSTTPAASTCTASGATDWTGTKAAAGSQVLAAVSSSKSYVLVCNWPGVTKAALAWDTPTTNSDGSALTNLAGFRVQYGTKSSATEVELSTSDYVNDPKATGWTSPALTAGTWYFGVKAFNTLGLEGAISNIVSKTITADASQQRALELAIKFPAAMTIR